DDLAVKRINPRFLERNWPPAFKAWSTKQVHDAFFASPKFPRLLNAEGIKETISDGVREGIFAYVGKDADGRYRPIHFEEPIQPHEIEISEDMFLIKADVAKKHIEPPTLTTLRVTPPDMTLEPEKTFHFTAAGLDQHVQPIEMNQPIEWSVDGGEIDKSGSFSSGPTEGVFTITASCGGVIGKAYVTVQKKSADGGGAPPPPPPGGPGKLIWTGDVPPRKWTNFYSKVLSKHSSNPENLTLKVTFEIQSEEGFSEQKIEETRQALRELGLEDDVRGG
ncbi:MAG: AAA family ATPase, partial [Candidatus Omnitrophica bacterium]|nr:AAA family ATPase [Candidatus Omnitrophota bacterium]